MFARARGCTGQTSGTRRDVAQDGKRLARAHRGLSTFEGRCSVTTPKPSASRAIAASMPARASVSAGAIARARCCEQRIDHHVADELDARRVDAFAREIRRGVALGRVKQVGELVGEDAIDLLGHVAVEASQAGFDVRDRRALLGSRPGCTPASN